MATKRKISSKKNKQLMIVEIAALIIVAAGAVGGGIAIYRSTAKKAAPAASSSVVDSSSVGEEIEERKVDMERLSQHFAYAQIGGENVGGGLCYIGENENGVSRAQLQPIYNAVFDGTGLQIASVANSGIKCCSEMINPLNDMLCDFYKDTQLRTVMIDSAYQSSDSQNNDAESPESSLPDDGFYDTYGNYVTFGYTDDYGNYYGDGYYDSYGNYMGYGYYQEDGSYVSYEDLAESGGAEPPQKSDKSDSSQNDYCACGEHSGGYSVDFSLYYSKSGTNEEFDGSDEAKWFDKNCWKYGFILRCPKEKASVTGKSADPSHFRYVGRTAAKIMHDESLALEELSGFMANYRYDSPLTVNTSDGTAIAYSIEDSGMETTNIQVPADSSGVPLEFEVSDCGDGRFIIFVLLTEDYLESAVTENDSSVADLSENSDSYINASNLTDY